MGSTLYESNNLSEFEDDSSDNSILLNSLNLSWNPDLLNINHNIALFIMNEFKLEYTSFDLNFNLKYNIIKNFSKVDNIQSKHNLISKVDINQFLTKFIDIISIKELENVVLKKKDIKKYYTTLHPVNTFLKPQNLVEIYKLKKSNKVISDIYDTHILPFIDNIASTKDSLIDEIAIPKYSIKKKITDKVDINQNFRDLLHSLYISFLLHKYIYDQFKYNILFTTSILFYNLHNFDLKDCKSKINDISTFFTKIINKLIHKIYTTLPVHYNNLIDNIKTPYNDYINIEDINTEIHKINKTLEKHLDHRWSVIYSKKIDQNDSTYKNKNHNILSILYDKNIIKVKNIINLDIIKNLIKQNQKQPYYPISLKIIIHYFIIMTSKYIFHKLFR